MHIWCYLCSVLFSTPSQGCKALSRQNSPSPPTCPTSTAGFTAESSPLAQKLRGTALKHPLTGCTTSPLGCVVHPKWSRRLFDTLLSVTCGLFHPYTQTDGQHGTHIKKTCYPKTKAALIVKEYHTTVVCEPLEQNSCKRVFFVAGGSSWSQRRVRSPRCHECCSPVAHTLGSCLLCKPKPEDAGGLDSALLGPHASRATKSAVALTSIVSPAKRELCYTSGKISPKIKDLCYKKEMGSHEASCM